MKSKKLQIFYMLGLCLASYFIFSSNSGGITGKSVVGCGTPGQGCHNSGAGATTMTLTGIPGTGFTPSTTYTLTLTVTNATQAAAGFDLTCSTGTLAVIAGQGTALNGTTEMRHTGPKNAVSGNTIWTMTWTSPAAGPNSVTFNIAGNAVNLNGNSTGDAFETDVVNFNAAAAAAAPTITSVTATGISPTGATVNANINANNDPATTNVEYGLTASYGSTVGTVPAVVTGNVATPVSATIGGLTPGTVYHYRVKSTNAQGTTTDIDRIFTTLPSSVSSIEKTGISIYPNPVADLLIYENKTDKSPVRFRLFSMNGSQYDIAAEQVAEGKYQLRTSGLAPGQYVLLMEMNGKTYYRNISK